MSKLCLSCCQHYADSAQYCWRDQEQLEQLEDEATPDNLGSYKIEERIGQGTTSFIYRGTSPTQQRPVAIKQLRRSLLSQTAVERFEKEVLVMSRLQLNFFVQAEDYGCHGDEAFIVMELIEGPSLKQRLSAGGRLSESDAGKIFQQIAKAAAFAHDRGILLSGLTPSDILFDSENRVHIVDFGSSSLMAWFDSETKFDQDLGVVGDPVYCSPEQVSGRELDPPSDMYKIGVMLFEAITGRPPFVDHDPYEICKHHVESMPSGFGAIDPELQVSPELERIVMQLLDKDPTRRISAKELLAELHKLSDPNDKTLVETRIERSATKKQTWPQKMIDWKNNFMKPS